MNSYIAQGTFPLMESVSALVITEKDKPTIVLGIPGAVVLSWGMWDQPEAANDEGEQDEPEAA